MNQEACQCFIKPDLNLEIDKILGMDEIFSDVILLVCPNCKTRWLRYTYELEGFTGSGRWYLGALSTMDVSRLTVTNAKSILEQLGWYFFGGSYFDGRAGRSSGKIHI